MGHKYRKKNRLRKQDRRMKRYGGGLYTRLISDDVASSMYQYWTTQLPFFYGAARSSTDLDARRFGEANRIYLAGRKNDSVTVGSVLPEVVIPVPDRES